MTTWEFAASGPVKAQLRLAAGTISVSTSPEQAVTVSLEPERPGEKADRLIADTRVSFEDGRLRVLVPERLRLAGSVPLALTVGLPEGSAVTTQAASADLACSGELGSLHAHTASGDVEAGRISGDAEVSSASGDVRLDWVGGAIEVSTASGDLRADRADGDVTVKTASGDVTVRRSGGQVSVKTASGDVRLGAICGERADVSTVSGDITAAVPAGVRVYLDLASVTGQVSSGFESRDDGSSDAALTLRCRSVSGDVRALRADQAVTR